MVPQLVWPFKTRRILGHGSFGVVIEAEHRMKLDLNYAVKIIPSSQIQSSEMSTDQNSEYQDLDPKNIREAQNWSICDHKNIVGPRSGPFGFKKYSDLSFLCMGFIYIFILIFLYYKVYKLLVQSLRPD